MLWLENSVDGRNSYFSDSEYYFLAGFRESDACMSYDGALLACVYRGLNFWEHNYFLFLLSYILCYAVIVSLASRRLAAERYKFVVSVFLFHPFIAFLIARGLKEIILILPILAYLTLLKWDKFSATWLMILFFSVVTVYMRPLGEYLSIALLLGAIFIRAKYLWVSVVCGLGATFFIDLLPLEISENLISHTLGFDDRDRVVQSIPAPIIFLFGPTPVRPLMAMFGDFSYAFGTPVTLYILLVGSLFSICCAYMTGRYILLQIRHFGLPERYLFLSALSLISIYSLIYGGAVDTRHRGLFFCMLGAVVLSTLIKRSRGECYERSH